jgi:ankyrin repeat protein
MFSEIPFPWVAEGHEAVVQLLLEKGAEADSKDNSGRTPLSWAVVMCHETVVQLLLKKGVETDPRDVLVGRR